LADRYNELDSMKVIALSEKDYYGQIGKLKEPHSQVSTLDVSDFEWEDICYLAICECRNSVTIFFCMCSENMSVLRRWGFSSFEQATESAHNYINNSIDAERQVKWVIYPHPVY